MKVISSWLQSLQKSRVPVSYWILAVMMAVVVVTVVLAVIGSSMLALSRPQDVRSQAATSDSTSLLTPQLTSLEIEPLSEGTSEGERQLAVVNDTGTTNELAEPSLLTDDPEEASEAGNPAAQVLALDDVPAGVSFVYVLIGLGIVIGGLAIGLIVLIKKFAGV